ncbi:hypothetical protein IscW_ISCW008599 [Ixodes scapularis]|uniref:Uncharacterized protein n=1 Tax=Ixodes scapularis TaxID=6945 RepID=B7Q366_IXOSC|nr:hypothetical protein IscW_ISCW008599 [Ixodes scapularis]|eukprot:XP_002411164.1 hypothetical protein IscW_ISCW008599 [Ixodes scapularis]
MPSLSAHSGYNQKKEEQIKTFKRTNIPPSEAGRVNGDDYWRKSSSLAPRRCSFLSLHITEYFCCLVSFFFFFLSRTPHIGLDDNGPADNKIQLFIYFLSTEVGFVREHHIKLYRNIFFSSLFERFQFKIHKN